MRKKTRERKKYCNLLSWNKFKTYQKVSIDTHEKIWVSLQKMLTTFGSNQLMMRMWTNKSSSYPKYEEDITSESRKIKLWKLVHKFLDSGTVFMFNPYKDGITIWHKQPCGYAYFGSCLDFYCWIICSNLFVQ